MRVRPLVLGALLGLLLAPVPATAREPIGVVTPPVVGTDPVYGERVQVEPGTWTVDPVDEDQPAGRTPRPRGTAPA